MPGTAGPRACATCLCLTLAVSMANALAQAPFPSRSMRIVIPTAPGGGNDLVGRMLAQGLTERFGVTVVPENRTGAGTVIGNDMVAKSKPDGYTLLMAAGALAVSPAMYRKMPYDAAKDFAAITQAASVATLVAVHPSVPAKTTKEMIALARSRPGEILFASAGHGTQPHLSMELFAIMAKAKMVHVAYKGTTPGLTDLLAGQVSIMAGNMPQLVPFVRARRLRALGVTTPARARAEPDIPTIAESGLPGYESVQWYGVFAPAQTPRDVVDRLNKEVVAILRTSQNRDRLAADGAEVVGSTPDAFAAFYQAELVKWAKVVRDAGIKPE
ncbi:MAG TPA: tripartite tricarboxylate transporter substrate binding protein [Burkholderiales bacterium]|nr:tripartite tricarboxylate transporter substrate binding protein [Burkholderiales bacterium]